jgi:hypothetical protein
MLRKRLTIAALEGYAVQTAGSIALARFISTWRIICSTIFDSWLRNCEWHKGKRHRHPHLHLNLLPAKPVDAQGRGRSQRQRLQLRLTQPLLQREQKGQSSLWTRPDALRSFVTGKAR